MQMNWTALAVAGLVGVAALGSGDTRNKMKLPSFAGVAEVLAGKAHDQAQSDSDDQFRQQA